MSEQCSLYCFHYISSLLLQSEFLATDTNVSTVSLWYIEYKDILIIFIMKIFNFNRNYSTLQKIVQELKFN